MGIPGISLQGMQDAENRVEKTARRIAQAGLPPLGESPDTVTLSEDVVGLMTAKNDFQANTNVVQAAEAMQQSLMDVIR